MWIYFFQYIVPIITFITWDLYARFYSSKPFQRKIAGVRFPPVSSHKMVKGKDILTQIKGAKVNRFFPRFSPNMHRIYTSNIIFEHQHSHRYK